jgi:aryl-alcohol dehydrogenase-like predicted oxidoreductase
VLSQEGGTGNRGFARVSVPVPPVALGCGNFGGIGSAPELFGQGESEEEAFAIMDAAWAEGIRWFDTADAYGGGRSEQTIGAWIAATGNRPRLTTKTFNPMDSGADHGLAPDRIRRQLESSLERLGLDRVDLYLAHDFDAETPLADTLAAFERLIDEGTIGAYGVSNFSAQQVEDAIRLGRPALVQNEYSLLERGDEEDVLPLSATHGVAYQAFSPLAGGWLTGKYRAGEPHPPGSRMTLRPAPYLRLDAVSVYRAIDRLGEEAAARGTSSAALALAWALSHPHVSGIVIGPRRPEHLEPALAARRIALSEDERLELASFFA